MWFRSCVLFKKAVCVFTYRLLKNLTSTKTPPFNQRSLPRVSLQQQKVGFTSVGFLKERTIPPNNIGIRTRQERSRHKPTNIMECHKVFLRCSPATSSFFVKRRAFEIAKKHEILLRTKESPLFHLFFFNSEKMANMFFSPTITGIIDHASSISEGIKLNATVW